jgi:hypothetical protein
VTYGGDSGNRIFVLYWRCPLIRVSVIRGSTVFYLLFLYTRSYTQFLAFLDSLFMYLFNYFIGHNFYRRVI